VLGGDFNSGAEEPRDDKPCSSWMSCATRLPSPRTDTIYVRNGSSTRIRVVTTRQALTEPVLLENGCNHGALPTTQPWSSTSNYPRAAIVRAPAAANTGMRAAARYGAGQRQPPSRPGA
jgi:hypothetical protein